jgi:hypothetical protein
MKVIQALGSGLIGAVSLTLLHETLRRLTPEAPRMDLLGMRALSKRSLSKSMRKLDVEPPSGKELFNLTMAGDLVSNALYYSLVGLTGNGKQAWLSGAGLGLAAGVGAVVLPSAMGLGSGPSRRTPTTALLTILLYLQGGVAAAAAYRLLSKRG